MISILENSLIEKYFPCLILFEVGILYPWAQILYINILTTILIEISSIGYMIQTS